VGAKASMATSLYGDLGYLAKELEQLLVLQRDARPFTECQCRCCRWAKRFEILKEW
jgi:hypothetical protein